MCQFVKQEAEEKANEIKISAEEVCNLKRGLSYEKTCSDSLVTLRTTQCCACATLSQVSCPHMYLCRQHINIFLYGGYPPEGDLAYCMLRTSTLKSCSCWSPRKQRFERSMRGARARSRSKRKCRQLTPCACVRPGCNGRNIMPRSILLADWFFCYAESTPSSSMSHESKCFRLERPLCTTLSRRRTESLLRSQKTRSSIPPCSQILLCRWALLLC